MSISHWGIFPGWFVASSVIEAGNYKAMWEPVDWDMFCLACWGPE